MDESWCYRADVYLRAPKAEPHLELRCPLAPPSYELFLKSYSWEQLGCLQGDDRQIHGAQWRNRGVNVLFERIGNGSGLAAASVSSNLTRAGSGSPAIGVAIVPRLRQFAAEASASSSFCSLLRLSGFFSLQRSSGVSTSNSVIVGREAAWI